jgi:hypothetical protein
MGEYESHQGMANTTSPSAKPFDSCQSPTPDHATATYMTAHMIPSLHANLMHCK